MSNFLHGFSSLFCFFLGRHLPTSMSVYPADVPIPPLTTPHHPLRPGPSPGAGRTNETSILTTFLYFRQPNRPQVSRSGVHPRRVVRVEFREPVRRPGVGQQRGAGGRHVELQAGRARWVWQILSVFSERGWQINGPAGKKNVIWLAETTDRSNPTIDAIVYRVARVRKSNRKKRVHFFFFKRPSRHQSITLFTIVIFSPRSTDTSG